MRRHYRRSVERLFSIPAVRTALASLGVFVRNFRSGLSYTNELWSELGYDPGRLSDDLWREVIHPDDLDSTMAKYAELVSGERDSFRVEYRIRSASGEWRWILNRGRVISWDKDGHPELYLGADVDITDRKLAEERAAETAQEAEALRMAGAIVASTLEIDRTVQLVLDQARNVVPYDTATVELLHEDSLEIIGGAGWDDVAAVLGARTPWPSESPASRTIRAQTAIFIDDLLDEFPGYSSFAGNTARSWLGVPLIVHGEVMGIVAFTSVSPGYFSPKHARLAAALGDHVAVALQNARLYEQTRELAMTDSLTGIATRRNLYTQAERILEQSRRSGRPISVIMTDLDHFKQINDDYGHARGDEAIVLAAHAARASLRKSDVIGRYGGEEFGIILPETDAESALAIAERIRSSVADVEVPGTDARLSISIGVVTSIPDGGETVDGLLDHADHALYDAKTHGRNRVACFAGQP